MEVLGTMDSLCNTLVPALLLTFFYLYTNEIYWKRITILGPTINDNKVKTLSDVDIKMY